MIAWLSALFTVFHLAILLLPDQDPYPVNLIHWPATLGLLGSLAAYWFNLQPGGWLAVRLLSLGMAAIWLGTDVYGGVLMHRGVTAWMVLDTVLMTMLLFSLLPLRQAVAGGVACYLLFLGAAGLAGERDPVLLALVGLTGGITLYLTVHGQLISQERLHNEVLRWQVQHDGLTGAMTRQALIEQVEPRLGGPHLLLLLDLDHFKEVNDRFGHQAGDEALRHVTRVMQAQVGPDDLVCRWGGEEFVVFLRNVTPAQGVAVAQQIREGVSRSQPPGLPPLTVSIGVASFLHAYDLAGVVAQADLRLYQAKARGRNQLVAEGGG